MFICNFKVDSKKIWKVTLVILIILIVSLLILASLKIFNPTNNISAQNSGIIEITSEEYTNFLKISHENINSYNGKTVKVVGYVYKLPNFSSNEFVIARTMVFDDNSAAVVVGMLCECNEAEKYSSGTWLEVTGTIKKGNYNGEIPILEISNIKTTKAPKDEFVHLPTD